MLMLMNSKLRMSNRRDVATSSGNSATHGAHQVAQTLNSRTFGVPPLRNAATPAASIGSMSTGVLSHFCIFSVIPVFLVIHLVEQPCGFVIGTGTGWPANNASTAFLASGDFTVASLAYWESSKRPL